LIKEGHVLAGHEISAGGLITTLLEMDSPTETTSLSVKINKLDEPDPIKALFAEIPGVVVQVKAGQAVKTLLDQAGVDYLVIAEVTQDAKVTLNGLAIMLDIPEHRDIWYN